jgi:hypothetical protein
MGVAESTVATATGERTATFMVRDGIMLHVHESHKLDAILVFAHNLSSDDFGGIELKEFKAGAWDKAVEYVDRLIGILRLSS